MRLGRPSSPRGVAGERRRATACQLGGLALLVLVFDLALEAQTVTWNAPALRR